MYRMQLEQLLTVKQVTEQCPALSEGSLRWWIFNAERNGLASALVRVGRRVYLDKIRLEEWIASQRVDL